MPNAQKFTELDQVKAKLAISEAKVAELERISGYADYADLNPERPLAFEDYLKRLQELAALAAINR